MTSALRLVKCDLESEDGCESSRRHEYKSWNSIRDELERVGIFKCFPFEFVILYNYIYRTFVYAYLHVNKFNLF